MILTQVINGERVNLTSEEQAEIEAIWQQKSDARAADLAANGYLYERRRNYPSIDESIEAIFDGLSQLRTDGVTLPQSTIDWLDTIQNIYDTYPAP